MTAPKNKPSSNKAIYWLFAGLILWACILAIGAVRQSSGDPRRAFMIAGVIGLFLLLWAGVLAGQKK